MRLREIKHRLTEAGDQIYAIKVTAQSGGVTKVQNLDLFLKTIRKLKKIEALDFEEAYKVSDLHS